MASKDSSDYQSPPGTWRLNKYLAHAGVASRRKADEIIATGAVRVNGEVVREMGHRLDPDKDVVTLNGETLNPQKKVYILLNKPKDVISTTKDTHDRRTVMDIIKVDPGDRVYPVGRLDRNTTGLLLLTNDGELAQDLAHPSKEVSKIYEVHLDRELEQRHFDQIVKGVQLEEGIVKVDQLAFPKEPDRSIVGIEIHLGWNRVIRRVFEKMGYEIQKLDRVLYAGLTKKDLPRGHSRSLSKEEIIMLKHFEASYKPKK